MSDIPEITNHETRALIYLHEVQMQRNPEKKAPNLSELEELTGWDSKYWTRSWKRLQPKGLIDRKQDGQSTRLELTENGKQVASLLMEINAVMDE